ncbi:tannase/feruloyl esterase family alpha/beta hydrolase [Paraburkholderia sprentiae WSM5005]|uniref:Tannase/feruloyl esterase family alpha/beta hydrolase n=1 Tax=Paraburkholderia sprentiae WSM5005 TaxID=754502 RepID=A0A8F4QI82_9BURK|nr:tannase/feruloyl esterase family alpha/beta hydrolase [Paraburkholderia sprentiae WSM5005]
MQFIIGRADPVVNPLDTIAYYDKVNALQGSQATTDSFFRLFMVPGMRDRPTQRSRHRAALFARCRDQGDHRRPDRVGPLVDARYGHDLGKRQLPPLPLRSAWTAQPHHAAL